jgi:effector-binding domain-containing protein
MIEKPFYNTREAETYVAIAVAITMEEFDIVDSLTAEVYEWLEQKGVAPTGPSFLRIVTSDMTAKLDVEVGVVVDPPPEGDDRVTVGEVPAGSYVTLFYTDEDPGDHLQSNVEIQAWGANEGVEWKFDRSDGVEKWCGRFGFDRPDLASGDHQTFELTYQIVDDSDS